MCAECLSMVGCRHTFCTNAAKRGISVETLKYLMGHTDISVTSNVYTHLKLEDAQREMERLSGGQQQRAWIAMALAQKTGLLFLDEPTTYLDISHQLDILYLLRRLNRENGVTIVMVLHDLNHAIMFSDYLVAIKDGTLHSAGTPQEVITRQALREIFDVEAEVITHPVLNVPVCLPFRITEQNKKTGGSNT